LLQILLGTHGSCLSETSTKKNLVGKGDGKRDLLEDLGVDGGYGNWIQSPKDRDQWRAFVNKVPLSGI
jgi:hypothetical protein